VSAAGFEQPGVRLDAWCWMLQRATAVILAICVAVHLVTIVVAIYHGLTAAAILGRTRGSAGWAVFYTVFVLSVALHAPLGLRPVLAEWLKLRGRGIDALLAVLAVLFAAGGLAAIHGVVSGP
jgi:fumarate reductase subunit C